MSARPWDKSEKDKKKKKGGKGRTADLIKDTKDKMDLSEISLIDDKKLATELPLPEVIKAVGELNKAQKKLNAKLKPYREQLVKEFKEKGIKDQVRSTDDKWYGQFEERTTVDLSKGAMAEVYGEKVVQELEGEMMAKGKVKKLETVHVRAVTK